MLNLTWQVHVHGEAGSELRSWAEARGVPLYVWPWGAEAKAAGLRRDGAGGAPTGTSAVWPQAQVRSP